MKACVSTIAEKSKFVWSSQEPPKTLALYPLDKFPDSLLKYDNN